MLLRRSQGIFSSTCCPIQAYPQLGTLHHLRATGPSPHWSCRTRTSRPPLSRPRPTHAMSARHLASQQPSPRPSPRPIYDTPCFCRYRFVPHSCNNHGLALACPAYPRPSSLRIEACLPSRLPAVAFDLHIARTEPLRQLSSYGVFFASFLTFYPTPRRI